MSNPVEILAYPLNKHMGAYDVQFVWQCGGHPPSHYYFDLAWWPNLRYDRVAIWGETAQGQVRG